MMAGGSAQRMAEADAGNMPWGLTRTAVSKWLASARAGDELVYARGPRLVATDGVQELRRLHDEGAVTFVQRRNGPGDVSYVAQRRAQAARPHPAQRMASPPPISEDADDVAILMAILRRLAQSQRPCPTNRELGQLIGGLGPDRVAYLLRKQISARRIAVNALGNGRRVVTIVATGKRTAATL